MQLYIDRLVADLAGRGGECCIAEGQRAVPASALLGRIFQYARAFEAMGVSKDSVVALLAPNRWEALAARYAVNLLGACACFLSVLADEEQQAALLASVAPDLLVVFAETRHLLPRQTCVRVIVAGTGPGDEATSLDDLAADCSDAPFKSRALPGDLAVIASSGGSTGIPKGSIRTFAGYSAMVDVPSPRNRRQLINGPLANLSQVLVDVTLLGGGMVVLQPHYEAAATLEAIASQRITDLFLVEPQLFELMDHPSLATTDLSSLRTLTHIGASAPPVLRLRARERFGPVIAHTYGASEEGLVSILRAEEHDPAFPGRFATAGRILPGVEVRFRRPDGNMAADGEAGTIEMRSAAMATGYRNRPEVQALAFADGWYRSGDLGFKDAEGYLHILGRAADIEPGPGPVTPTMVEDILCRVAGIRYACVVVDHDEARWFAFILPWAGHAPDLKACRAALERAHGIALASRTTLVQRHDIPLTPQGKPDHEALLRLGRASRAAAGTSEASKTI